MVKLKLNRKRVLVAVLVVAILTFASVDYVNGIQAAPPAHNSRPISPENLLGQVETGK